jgi:4-amino-4-deoxy-L-arabinose transferase-like glycosyltransferase
MTRPDADKVGVGPRRSRFALRLGVVVACAFAVRVGAAFFWNANTSIHGDALWYWGVARALANGHGFSNPFPGVLEGRWLPTAIHPPLYPAYLSVAAVTGHGSVLAMRLWSTLPGTAAVLVIGLTGRDIAGERTGLLAAALAAVYVMLFAQDIDLWSEGMFIFTIALTLYASYRFIRRPNVAHALFLGGAISLAALTRAEAAVLYVVLLLPLVLMARAVSWRRRLGLLAAGVAMSVALVAPWSVYSSQRFVHPVYFSNGFGPLVNWANCPPAYRGRDLGGWVFGCAKALPLESDETVNDLLGRRQAEHYARTHADRLPVVIPVRVLRTFGFYRPDSITAGELNLVGGNLVWLARLALVQYWVMLLAGVVGAIVLHRRRVPLLPFAAMLVVVLVITVLGYGTVRFRAAFDATLPVLAAVGAQHVWDERRTRDRDRMADTESTTEPLAGSRSP